MDDKVKKLVEWGKSHGLTIDADSFDIEEYNQMIEGGYPAEHLFVNDPADELRDLGEVFDGEMGFGPEEYLQGVVEEAFDLVKDHSVSDMQVSTDDEWESANVTLKVDGETLGFTISDVDNSDWIPDDLYTELEQFSKAKLKGEFAEIKTEDYTLLLYLPENDLKSLKEIVPF